MFFLMCRVYNKHLEIVFWLLTLGEASFRDSVLLVQPYMEVGVSYTWLLTQTPWALLSSIQFVDANLIQEGIPTWNWMSHPLD